MELYLAVRMSAESGDAAISNADGRVILYRDVPPMALSLLASQRLTLRKIISRLNASCESEFGVSLYSNCSGMCLSVSGLHTDADRDRVSNEFDSDEFLNDFDPVICEDVWTELACCGANCGVLGLVSTGVNSFARSIEGDSETIGGWGSDLSDHGSGYFIGRLALQRVLDGFDGRHSVTHHFVRAILDELGLSAPRQINEWYEAARKTEFWRSKVSSLSKQICELAELRHDPCASEILSLGTKEFERSMVTIMSRSHERFFAKLDCVPICLAGGLANMSQHYQRGFMRVVSAARGGAIDGWPADSLLTIKPQIYAPIIGALVFAHCGTTDFSDESLLKSLKESGEALGIKLKQNLIGDLDG